jgi:branched-chain amino acid aminotransferase
VSELGCLDGRIERAEETFIPATDEGFLRGDGVFEVVRVYDGKPFALAEHLDRLERSAANLQLGWLVPRAALEEEIPWLLAERGGEAFDGVLRVVLTRGGHRLLLTEQLPATPERVRLAFVTYAPTRVLTGVKSLSYAANMQATRLAQEQGAEEAVLVRPDDIVLEAPTSTIFWVSQDGVLLTPALDVGILESITRDRLVRELEVEEGAYAVQDLRATQEAFLASTVREVQPISAIDGRELPSSPGERTREAIEAFGSVLERELEASPSGKT